MELALSYCHPCSGIDPAGLIGARKETGCKCAADPEAHTKASFCTDKDKAYKADHKDDTWEIQMGVACSKGCKQCCEVKGDVQTFLQVPDECNKCMLNL